MQAIAVHSMRCRCLVCKHWLYAQKPSSNGTHFVKTLRRMECVVNEERVGFQVPEAVPEGLPTEHLEWKLLLGQLDGATQRPILMVYPTP